MCGGRGRSFFYRVEYFSSREKEVGRQYPIGGANEETWTEATAILSPPEPLELPSRNRISIDSNNKFVFYGVLLVSNCVDEAENDNVERVFSRIIPIGNSLILEELLSGSLRDAHQGR